MGNTGFTPFLSLSLFLFLSHTTTHTLIHSTHSLTYTSVLFRKLHTLTWRFLLSLSPFLPSSLFSITLSHSLHTFLPLTLSSSLSHSINLFLIHTSFFSISLSLHKNLNCMCWLEPSEMTKQKNIAFLRLSNYPEIMLWRFSIWKWAPAKSISIFYLGQEVLYH